MAKQGGKTAGKRSKTQSVSGLDFAFFNALWLFYEDNHRAVRTHYRDLTKRFLDYNGPDNPGAYLRKPQYEALEMYVFLKEFLENKPVHELFAEWRQKASRFGGRSAYASNQLGLFAQATEDQFGAAFDLLTRQLGDNQRDYANYIFALTMGTGKTILMATCIFYEFLLANKFPKDLRYCHNALVFAPDTTVLEALREIQTFDMTRVVPPEYVDFLTSHIQYHFLDEAGMALSTLDRSRFNLIISNTQKIILKRQHKQKSSADQLFRATAATYDANSVYAQYADIYEVPGEDDEAIETEDDLTTNQRFEKLRRLSQLGIYVDEAHHAFGKNLERDVGAVQDTRITSLRVTIDELARSLKRAKTHVVACYNYTGTPYVENRVLPEVVYAYGLREAIDAAYLKKVRIHSYSNVKSEEFVAEAVSNFLAAVGDVTHERLTPKLAFFASTIAELQDELRPALEKALGRYGIPADRILVNVGDSSVTTSDDIREFNRLDRPESTKQFILLVGKGREGWNCRSLFGVALFREPKSKIFVLQATMRCLRSIGEGQQVGQVYLSRANVDILQDELQQNFRVTVDEIQALGGENQSYTVRVMTPPVKIHLKRVRHMYQTREKDFAPGTQILPRELPLERYQLVHETYDHLPADGEKPGAVEDISYIREQSVYSRLTLVAEIARYLNKPCLQIEEILEATADGTDQILAMINRHNEVLFDYVIPELYHCLYDVTQYDHAEEEEVELVKTPEGGHYTVTASPSKVVTLADTADLAHADKSFHLDTYAFDSTPEKDLFWRLLRDGRVEKVYFTGMLTHGQSEFYIQYIDPETKALRRYFPDFLLQKADGSWVIVEVKGDNKIDDPVVKEKQKAAEQVAVVSGMKYKIIRGSEAEHGDIGYFFNGMPYIQPRL